MYLVGIAGGSASGKSTFTAALLSALEARDAALRIETRSTDQFWQDRNGPPRFISPSTGEERFHFNHPDALDQQALFAELDQLAETADVVLLEGLMVLHVPAVRERLDLRLFVELDADEVDVGSLVPSRLEWYGWDPIHVRRGQWRFAWKEILSAWDWEVLPATHLKTPLRRKLQFFFAAAERRWLFGRQLHHPQPCLRWPDDSTLSLY